MEHRGSAAAVTKVQARRCWPA